MKPDNPNNLRPLKTATIVCILLYISGALLFPGFASMGVFVNFFTDYAFYGILAVGLTIVLISGGIDLSIGSVFALCGVVFARLLAGSAQFGAFPSIFLVLLIGTIIGLINGITIHRFRLNPLLVTIIMLVVARCLAYAISQHTILVEHNPFITHVSKMGLRIGYSKVPAIALISLAVIIAGVIISSQCKRTKVLAYAISGFCSALAAVVYVIYMSSGSPSAGMGIELDVFAIVLAGGTLLSGGKGHVLGALVGTLTYGIIQTLIMFDGRMNPSLTPIGSGIFVLSVMLFRRINNRTKPKEG